MRHESSAAAAMSETTEIQQIHHGPVAGQQLISKDTLDVQVRPKGLLEVRIERFALKMVSRLLKKPLI